MGATRSGDSASRVPDRAALAFFPMLSGQHPTRWRFPEFLSQREPWVAELQRLYATDVSFPASVSPEAGLFLMSLAMNLRPRVVIEIGTFLGVSTIWLAAGLEAVAGAPGWGAMPAGRPPGVIHVFDHFRPIAPGPWRSRGIGRGRRKLVEGSLTRAGLGHRVVIHEGDSAPEVRRAEGELIGPRVVQGGEVRPDVGGVDLAFIDGDHGLEGASADFLAAERVLNIGGYVVLHDIFPEQCGMCDGPRHILDRWQTMARGKYEACEVYTAPLNYGMAVMRRLG